MPMCRTLPENTRGRDFIVGDLHGCRHLLEDRLYQLNFDPTADRVLQAGDLNDRGPFSLNTLALVFEPWFFSVLGNHEDMLLNYTNARPAHWISPFDLIYNGGEWVELLSAEESVFLEEQLLPKLLETPYVIRVEGARPYYVLHAEAGLSLADDPRPPEELLSDEVWVWRHRQQLTWSKQLGRQVKQRLRNEGWSLDLPRDFGGDSPLGNTPIYVGHTILPTPACFKGHYFLDGGTFHMAQGEANRPTLDGKPYGQLVVFNHTENCFV